jgi:glycosyltransferase involved in cell wall biosynthesis
VLLASPLPPPHGGIGTWTRIVLQQGLGGYVPVVVNTAVSSRRASFEERPKTFDELQRNLRILVRFTRELVRSRPVLVHVNSSLSTSGIFRDASLALVARALRRPVVAQFHGRFEPPRGGARGWLARGALRCLLRLASANLVLSPSFLVEVERSGGTHRPRCLPNFIDDAVLARAPVDRSQRVGPLRVLYAGSLIATKGSAELLETARRMPSAQFVALGVVPSHEHLHPPPNLDLRGSQPRDVVLSEMDRADVLLFPSHDEGFPYTVLEAMALSLPVVASRVGAIPDMIEHGRGGFLVEPRNVDGLCTALAALQADPSLRACMGAHNRARVEAEYTHAAVVAQLADIYDEVRATFR